MVVAIVGASNDRAKFGNKSLRAHAKCRYDVYPVNLHEHVIEGAHAYRSVLDIPVEIDRVTIYLPPEITLTVIDDIARKGTRELYLNPGSHNNKVIEAAKAAGLEPILDCSIVAIGESPGDY